MGGDSGRTEDTVHDRGFSLGGFLIDEPSNKPLQRSYAVQGKRTGTDRGSVGTRDPFRKKRKRQ
jgi:hypothetical protein